MFRLPNHLRPRREKVFGDGPCRKLDREAKLRVMTRARALMRRTEPGKHYGAVTAKALAVLRALLWDFHNSRSGLCFPSYEAIAERAGCARSTVGEAIAALEHAGVLGWVNRLTRVADAERDLFGHLVRRWRVIRTSNSYCFHDPKATERQGRPSKSDFRSGTPDHEYFSNPLDPENPLDRALIALRGTLGAAMKGVS